VCFVLLKVVKNPNVESKERWLTFDQLKTKPVEYCRIYSTPNSVQSTEIVFPFCDPVVDRSYRYQRNRNDIDAHLCQWVSKNDQSKGF
jgi:hypothetical protein